MFLVIIFVICFFVFLFTLFSFGNDDIVFLRKNVAMEKIFDIAICIAGFTLLFARVGYVLFHFSKGFLHPLVFFLFPYFPGLSLGGGIMGAFFALFLFCRYYKLPTWRVIDIFLLSFLSALPLGYFLLSLGSVFARRPSIDVQHITIGVVYGLVFLCAWYIFSKSKLHEGSLAFVVGTLVSILQLSLRIAIVKNKVVFGLQWEDIVWIAIFVIGSTLFVWRERFIPRMLGKNTT